MRCLPGSRGARVQSFHPSGPRSTAGVSQGRASTCHSRSLSEQAEWRGPGRFLSQGEWENPLLGERLLLRLSKIILQPAVGS